MCLRPNSAIELTLLVSPGIVGGVGCARDSAKPQMHSPKSTRPVSDHVCGVSVFLPLIMLNDINLL